jgi:diaminohydroxyphosphoribosylaminopyrimidine deaminase/5-amino-6-(5-phosphoribosylamino)uracil reductase
MVSAYYLNEALKEAQKADPKLVRPNPLVGAVVVDENQDIVGRGYHKKIGTPHAEVHAIADAEQNGADLSKCTLYVTLEPCSHHGRTPPCTDLIILKKIPSVVVGSRDPNPLVNGIDKLRKENIDVVYESLPEAERMNKVFFVNQMKERPFFTLKMAISKNGMIGKMGQKRFWLSNEQSRNVVHEKLRTVADAILTTAKTIINDDAKMNIRIQGNQEQELSVVVVDKDLILLDEANKHLSIFYPRANSKIYLVTDRIGEIKTDRPDLEVIVVPFNSERKVDLETLGKILLIKGICRVLVEAGATLGLCMLNQQFIDEVHLFIAPFEIDTKEGIPFLNFDFQNLHAHELSGFKIMRNENLSSDHHLVYER